MAKPLLGVVHLGPLPSAPRGGGGTAAFEAVLAAALHDARALREGGVDGVMVENFGDAPFRKGTRDAPVSPDVPAALAVVARAVRAETSLPVGINCLRNDGVAALGAAVIAGAAWVRVNVLSGSYVTDQGRIDGEADRVLGFRRTVGTDALLLADVFVKHAAPLAPIPVEVAARDVAARSGADGLIVSGPRTGAPPTVEFLDTVAAAVAPFPVWLGSGLDVDNAAALWPRCSGAIVGTAVKRDGAVHNPVDPARVAALRAAIDRA